jgi:hypothetical protein
VPTIIVFSLLFNNVYNENNILVNIFTDFFSFEERSENTLSCFPIFLHTPFLEDHLIIIYIRFYGSTALGGLRLVYEVP